MEVKKFKSIKQMNRHTGVDGQYAMVGEKIFQYKDDTRKWEPFSPTGAQLEIAQNMYAMAKTVAAQAPAMTDEVIQQKKEMIAGFLKNNSSNKYFMLLLKEIDYYTLFVTNENSNENMSDVIIECLQNLGAIVDINDESAGAIEVWVKDEFNEAHIGYFFPYDQGVIECLAL